MLSRMRIKTRLYAGFLVVLALLGVVAVGSFWVFGSVAEHFGSFSTTSTIATSAQQLDRQVFAFDRHFAEYVRAPSDEAGDKVKAELTALQRKLKDFEAQVDGTPLAENVAVMAKAFDTYNKQLGPVMDLVSQRTTLITSSLEPLADELVSEVTSVRDAAAKQGDAEQTAVAGRLIEHMIQAQRAVESYLQNHSDEAFAKAWEELFAVDDAIATLDTDGSAEDLYQAYQDALNALSATISEIDVAETTLDKQGQIITAEATKIKDAALSQQTSIRGEMASQLSGARVLVMSLTLVSLLIGLTAAVLIGHSVVSPLLAMTNAMRRLSSGDKSVEIPATGRHDEIGQMASAVQVFKDNALEVERLERDRHDSETAAAEERRTAMLRLADELERSVAGSVETIADSATQMQSAAQAMSATAADTTRQAATVATATQEANSNVEVVASAAEELSASIDEIASQVNKSAQVASDAVGEARRANSKVESLLESTSKIGEVVQLITDIAEQTNLLALNATIEAARAGEAGKGFAVVANEVKNLATQTGRATEDISNQIEDIQSSTRQAVEAIQSISRVIDRMNEYTSAISAAVEEQGAATQEIARNTQQAAQGTQAVTDTIGEVTSAAQETGQAASEVLETANGLLGHASTLDSSVHQFLGHVRSA